MMQWFYTHSLDVVCLQHEPRVVSALLVLLKARFIPHLLVTRIERIEIVLGKTLTVLMANLKY